MVPAPKAFQSPTVFAAVRQEELRPATATALELVLIFVAFFISLVLSLMPRKSASSRRPWNTVYSSLAIAIALFSSFAAVSLAIATLVLGWLGLISLDAVAGIVFALGPAIFSIPREILSYSRDSLIASLIWGHLSMGRTTNKFRYVRLIQSGQVCLIENSKHSMVDGSSHTTGGNKETNWFAGENLMVIRHITQTSSGRNTWHTLLGVIWNRIRYFKLKDRKKHDTEYLRYLTEDRLPSEMELHNVRGIHFYGIRTGTFSNFATIEDIDNGKTSWWWNAVSSSRYLIARPGRVYLESNRRVGKALALLYDIISIGDLVLHFHLHKFEWMLQMDHDVRNAVISAPGFTCNRFIQELELEGWNSIGPEDLLTLPSPAITKENREDSDKTENSSEIENSQKTNSSDAIVPQPSFSIPSSKHYALLFLILAEKSQRFLLPVADDNGKIPCSQHLLDELFKAKDWPQVRFHRLALRSVDEWLQGWGLNVGKVDKLRTGH